MRDITLEDTVYFAFTTRAFATGIPTLLGGTPALSVLESNNATPITSGVSVQVDRAAVVGLNQATVVATAANGYEVGKSYAVYVSTGTVGGVSVVGEVVAEFTVQASAAAVDLANGTDGLGAIKTDTAAILADTGTDGVVVAAGSKTGYTLTATTGLGNQAANITGNLSGSVGSVGTGGITAGSFAAGAIDAAAIAANAIGASELAADAVAEIADAVWDEAQADHVAVGSFGITASEIADILVDTAEIGVAGAGLTNIDLPNQTMNITGNITGNLSGSVGSVTGAVGSVTGAVGSVAAGGITAASIATGAIDADALATDAVNELVDAVWDEAQADHIAAGSFGLIASEIADILVDTAEIGAAGVGLTEAGGDGDHLTAINLPNQTMDIVGNITGNLSGSVGSVTGAVGSVTGAVGSVTGAVGSVAAGGITAASIATGALDADALATDAVSEITAAIKALVVESEGSYTVGQVLSILLAACAGVTDDSGATLKTPNGTTTRIAATIASNERTAMTLTPSS